MTSNSIPAAAIIKLIHKEYIKINGNKKKKKALMRKYMLVKKGNKTNLNLF